MEWNTEQQLWAGEIGFYIRACEPKKVQFEDGSRTLTQRVDIQNGGSVDLGERQTVSASCSREALDEDMILSASTRYLLNKGILNRVTIDSEVDMQAAIFETTGAQDIHPIENATAGQWATAYFRGYSFSVTGGPVSYRSEAGANLGTANPFAYINGWEYTLRDSTASGWTDPTTERVNQASTSDAVKDYFSGPSGTLAEQQPETESFILDETESKQLAEVGKLHAEGWARKARIIGAYADHANRTSALWVNTQPDKDADGAYGDWFNGANANEYDHAVLDHIVGNTNSLRDEWIGYNPIEVTAEFSDNKKPTVQGITAPEGPFYAGDIIPITVEFSEPVNASAVTFRVADSDDGAEEELAPAQSGLTSERITFLYQVQEENTASIYPSYLAFADLSGNAGVTLEGNSAFGELNADVLCGGAIRAPMPEDAFGAVTVTMGEDSGKKPVATVAVDLDGPDQAVEDVTAKGELNEADGRFYLYGLEVSLDGGETRTPFYFDDPQDPNRLLCEITLDYNTTGSALPFTAELWWTAEAGAEAQLLLGKIASGEVPSTIFAAEKDFAIAPSEDFETYSAQGKTLFYQDFLSAEARPQLSLGLKVENSSITFQQRSDFAWASTDASVATINNDPASDQWGTITLTGKSGTVGFTLTALNGNAEGKQVTLESKTLTVDMGSTPFLSVPAGQETLSITRGQSLTVNWTSNLSEKNDAEIPGAETSFQVAFFAKESCTAEEDGKVSVNEGVEPIYTAGVTGNAEKPASSAVIPAEHLTELGYPAYRVRVSYGAAGAEDYLELWYAVNVKPAPAGVRLTRPESLYILDNQGSLDLSFTLSSFVVEQDQELNGAYELYIVDSSGKTISTQTDINQLTQSGADYTGSYTLEIPKVTLSSDEESYRDVYTVALKAKNGPDATWSYDSFLLYVYSDEALRLWIDGEPADGALTMTNVPELSALYAGDSFEDAQAAVLAMERNISLKNMISINYGDYAWGALCDRVAWSVEDSLERGDVATVNYNRGGLYENINYFDRTSYAPTDEFILSGLTDGSARVTVKHVLTGDSASLDLSVETLTDKLYLFQCYPKLPTTLTYTNGEGETRTVTSEADGRAAIYEPSGIASDVLCRSETMEGGAAVVYLGTVYNANLVSGERDSTRLELYPLNNLQLRRAARATLYFKNPDGTPYTGTVTFRGGVYREGEYANAAKFAFQSSQKVSLPGTEDQLIQLGNDGKLVITMDITQFTTDSYPDPRQHPVQAGENLQYMMELRFSSGDGKLYQPIFTSVDASLNEEDVTSSGDAIYTLTEAEGEAPFIAGQTVRYSENGDRFSVLDHTGFVGPNSNYPSAWLSTSVLWWGDKLPADADAAANTVNLQDAGQRVLPNQTVENIIYPFSTMLMTTHTARLDQSAMERLDLDTYDARNLSVTLSRDGVNTYRTSQLPFRLVNMIGAPATEDAESLHDALEQLGGTSVDVGGKMDTADKLLQAGMKLVASSANYSTEATGFGLKLAPTEDPLRFLGFITINAGNMDSGHNITGVYPADGSGGGKKASTDFDYLPSVISIAKMCTGKYLSSEAEDMTKAIEGKGVRNIHFDLGGYMESEIVYNTTLNKWEIHVLNGGFHAGGGLSYSWYNNMLVGPVPVTISLTAGGTMEISLDAQNGNYTYYPGGVETASSPEAVKVSMTDTDYLTELRLFLYARVFAGIGFDISVIAFKVGIFGQIDADLRFQWLNRPYLDSYEGKAISDVGPENTRQDSAMEGLDFSVTGTMGIEFFVKFLFVSYEQIFASASAQLWNPSAGDWEAIQNIWQDNARINGNAVKRTSINGVPGFEIDLGAQLEDRSYLDNGVQRTWGSSANGLLDFLSLDEEGVAESLQTNAYPYANPVVSDDGELMVYLSDMDSGDVSGTRAVWSVKSGSQFMEGRTPIDDGGYGDSHLQLAGSKDSAVAVWVRQSAEITKEITGYDENGSPIYAPLTPADQALQSNSTEIMAAVWDGESWTSRQLTENGTPDLAPVVATNGTMTVAAWRAAAASDNEAVTTFDQQDNILYRVYRDGEWSDQTYTLYDGSSTAGAVKGLRIDMMEDGTTGVVYTLDTNGANSTTGEGWETLAAVIPSDGDEDGIRTVRLTDNEALDENPQIAAATFADEEERFVVGWHTQRTVTESGNLEDDIRLAVLGENASLYNGIPDSVSEITAGTDLTIGSNFRFAKNADSIEDLSILWVDSVAPENGGRANSLEEAYSEVGYDILKAVKFIDTDGGLSLSSAMTVAEMRGDGEGVRIGNSLIDHFDAWMEQGEVHSILLATQYGNSKEKTVIVERGGEEPQEMSLLVADPVSGMYTATGTFTNQVAVPTAAFDYDDIFLNTDIPVQFTVRNNGTDPIEEISIQIAAGEPQTFEAHLLPNQTVILTADCPVEKTVQDMDYTVTAKFASKDRAEDKAEAQGKLCLDIPDVGISRLTLVEAQEGLRTIQFSLYNQLTAPLKAERDTVEVAFYADAAHTHPLVDCDGAEIKLEITGEDDLALINSGGYSQQIIVDVKKTIGEDTEIPKTGFPVYALAWIEQENQVVSEYHASNNAKYLNCQSLLEQYGTSVHTDSTLNNGDGGSTVMVTIRNNSLLQKTTGNVIVTLYNAQGEVVAVQQVYTGAPESLITLEPEAVLEKTFQFDKTGARAEVIYGDLTLDDESNSELSTLVFSGIGTKADFILQEDGLYTATINVSELASTTVTAMAADPKAAITVNGLRAESGKGMVLNLNRGENVLTVEVEAQNGSKTTYMLTVKNSYPSSGGSVVSHAVTIPKDTEHGTVTVSPEKAKNGQTVTITAKPDEGYQVGKVTVTDRDGDLIKVIDKGSCKYTFTMPGGKVSVEVTFVPEGQWTNPFVDVAEDAWYYDAVKYVNENGLMAGTSANTFAPDLTTTRGMIVTILYRLEGTPNIENENWGYPFKDVDANAYYATAVYWARLHGIVAGYSDELFGPNDTITREQMATILYRYAQYKGYDTTARADLSRFTDAAQVGPWAVDAIRWANAEGMINGTSDTTLSPKGSATRAQAAAILTRFRQNIAK